MPLQTRPMTDFTHGELGPKFSGRFDLDLYRKGCQTLDNWVPFTQGGVRTRPGSEYLGTTKSGAAARMIPFTINRTYPFRVELTNNLIRIWNGDSLVGAPTEVVTTYTTAELFEIQYQKVRNELYLVHRSHPIAVLTWNGGTSFTLADLTIDFADDVDAWAAGTAYAVGDIVKNGTPTKIYECITAGTSAGSGGPTTEADDITDNTVHWYWQATKPFSQTGDYPAAIAHFLGRMFYASSTNAPQTIWGSQPYWYGDFNLFTMITYQSTQLTASSGWADPLIPETETITYSRQVYGDASAFFFEIASADDDEIYWIMGKDALIIGTSMGEWILPPDATALNINPKRRSGFGSAFIQAVDFQEAPIFAQGTPSKALLKDFAYLAQSAELQSSDLTFGNDTMLENGVSQFAVMRVPQPTLFCVTNGELACLLYNKQYNVMAWYHISLDTSGSIESVCVSPGTTDDEVYIVVNRENGRVVDRLDHLWDNDAVALDSYVDVTSIAGATQTGLERFNGKTVSIYHVTDDAVYTAAVAAGSLTYPAECEVGDHVVIGLGFECRGQTMRQNSRQGEISRAANIIARVLESRPFQVGYNETGTLETSQRADAQAWTSEYTGDVPVSFEGDWSRDNYVWFLQTEPYHTTILVLSPEVST